ncbi:MAG: protoheme IX farnesyltransferase [Ignavibacteria bacterium]|nr:protoheme IX farnesyltransferase [Ignavibacteria bacterium]
MIRVKNFIPILLELSKIRITFFVMLTTVFGFICSGAGFSFTIVMVAIGVFLLACSSAVINQIQERVTDKLMQRTQKRPLVTGKISVRSAIFIAIIQFISAISLIGLFGGITALLLGLLTLVWYNLIYTPLKKHSYMTIVPGSVIGALPPVIGWVSAGRGVLEPQILAIAFFFFIWQIPHFWLLSLVYRNEYENAGFPTLFRVFSPIQVSRITYVWIFATGLSGLLFPMFSIIKPGIMVIIIAMLFIWLAYKTLILLKEIPDRKGVFILFREINMYVLGIVFLVSLEKIITLL